MTNLDNILKRRGMFLPTKIRLVKFMVFPVVMYGCESWNIRKNEHHRIDAFVLWCGEDSWESLGLQIDQTWWHHWCDGHEFEWTLGVGDGQGGLACWDSWGRKESDTTELLSWTELNWKKISPDIHLKGWCWNSNILATWWEDLSHWRGPWYWEILKAEKEGDDKGWLGWMAS